MLIAGTTLLFFVIGFGYPTVAEWLGLGRDAVQVIVWAIVLLFDGAAIVLSYINPDHMMVELGLAALALILGFVCAIPTAVHLMWRRGQKALAELERSGTLDDFKQRYDIAEATSLMPEPRLWRDLGRWLLRLPCSLYRNLRNQ
ncbi:MAG TPA: hypothetical protein VLF59_00230 [Candidatus Saccharimonadales bacterium]|nr:hypothetical protein [Candidatus Saccharimonadales bacterium]